MDRHGRGVRSVIRFPRRFLTDLDLDRINKVRWLMSLVMDGSQPLPNNESLPDAIADVVQRLSRGVSKELDPEELAAAQDWPWYSMERKALGYVWSSIEPSFEGVQFSKAEEDAILEAVRHNHKREEYYKWFRTVCEGAWEVPL